MAQLAQPTTTSSLPTPEDGQQCSNCGTTKTPLWRRAPDGTLICNACGLYLRSNHTHRPVNLKRPPNTITISKEELGSCKGDGRCNGTGGSAACRGCPAFNNRIVAKKQLLEKSPKNEDVKIKTDISANGEEGGQSGISENNASTNSQTKSGNSNSGQTIERSKTSASAASATGSTDENSLAIACYNCDTTITPLWRRDDAGNTICNACGLFYRLHGSHRPIKMKRSTIKRRKRNVSDHKSKEESKDVKMSVTSPGRMVSLTASPTPTPSHAPPSLQQNTNLQHNCMHQILHHLHPLLRYIHHLSIDPCHHHIIDYHHFHIQSHSKELPNWEDKLVKAQPHRHHYHHSNNNHRYPYSSSNNNKQCQ